VFAAAAIIIGMFFERSNLNAERERSFYEPLLAAGLLFVPFVGFAVTKIGHGALTGRYFLSMALGMAIATSYVLRPLRQRGLVLLVPIVFLLVGIGQQQLLFWKGEHERVASVHLQADPLDKLLKSAGQSDLPVAVSDGKEYTTIAYYARGEEAKRLVGIVDALNARAYIGSDSVDLQMSALTCCLPSMHVYEFRSFATENPRFLLYSGGGDTDWWPAKLLNDGYNLEAVASDGNKKIYRVDLNRDTHFNSVPSQRESR
jgi:hypothetical protein